jgi:cytochrome P450
MTTTEAGLGYDPYDTSVNSDPYPAFRRLREEAPLYYNEEYDFWAVSRADDVEAGLRNREQLISGRGAIIELIHSGIDSYPGTVIFEDPPEHTLHRRLLSRMFTPRKVAALEPEIRRYCREALDSVDGADRFDLISAFAAEMPMRVIGSLVGIPEQDQAAIRRQADATLRTEAGKPMEFSGKVGSPELFAEYIDWRVEHPSDDIMTELLNAEFEDETGTVRRLTRDELLTYVSVVSGAGAETTTRLIGWMAKVLAEHPEQRALVREDRSLLDATVEEVLRFEPPAPHVGRYAVSDVEFTAGTVPAGSAVLCLVGAANRDDRRFPDGDTFDIRREPVAHFAFGHGAHFCLGASLARLEGRIALDELLDHFPEWDVDLGESELAPTSTVRGWERLEIVVP